LATITTGFLQLEQLLCCPTTCAGTTKVCLQYGHVNEICDTTSTSECNTRQKVNRDGLVYPLMTCETNANFAGYFGVYPFEDFYFSREKDMEQIQANQIRDLYQQDLSVKAIAEQYQISTSMIYSILRNESNHDPLYKLKKKLKVDPEMAWRLYREGKTYAEISSELSAGTEFISPSLIGHHIRKKWAEENLQ
jgi:predicted DNA-binding protein YlxM (UPF0122 family)